MVLVIFIVVIINDISICSNWPGWQKCLISNAYYWTRMPNVDKIAKQMLQDVERVFSNFVDNMH